MPELQPKNVTLREETVEGAPLYPKTSVGQIEGLDTYLEGKGYLTSHQSLSGLATEEWVGQQGYLTAHQDISGLASTAYVDGEISRLLGNGEIAETYDTIKEISEYIAAHGSQYTDLVTTVNGKAEKTAIFKLDVTKIAEIEKALKDGVELGTLATDPIILNEKTEAELIQAIDDAVNGVRDLKIIACKCKTNKSGEYTIDKEYALANITVERKSNGSRKLKANGVLNADCIAKIELNTTKNVQEPTEFERISGNLEYNEYDSETEPSKFLSKTLLTDSSTKEFFPDGRYRLKAEIINGEPTFEWALDSNVSDLYLEFEEEPTQAQLEQIYTQKPDILRLGTNGSQHIIVLHKSLQSESETRLNYFNIQNASGDIQVFKIEYSAEDGYIAEPYEWSLDNIISGTNDGTNWTSLTIDGDTYGIPQGGGAEIEYAANADIDALFEEPEPEDIPVESIEFTNLPEDHSIELNVGNVVDMSQYIEVNPADATDKSYTLTTDAPSVLSVNGTTVTVLPGAEGLNANLTVTANDGSGCSDTMIVDILNGEEPEPEPEVPIQSLRYTDGSGNTCVGFGMLVGESVDLWTNLEITPSDATDGVEFMSDDDGIVMVDGAGVATATGVAGESTTITMSSMGDPSIFTTVEISINIDDEEPEEE